MTKLTYSLSYSLIMLSAVVLIGSSVFSVGSVVSPACFVSRVEDFVFLDGFVLVQWQTPRL